MSSQIFDWPQALQLPKLVAALETAGNTSWADALSGEFQRVLSQLKNGNLPRWLDIIQALPVIEAETLAARHVNQPRVGVSGEPSAAVIETLATLLRGLRPWRKGPFELFGIHIDTEWRSDWKWERVRPHITSLKGRRVLDVGCGNGYYAWRMAGEGARLVLGVDPNWLFMCQFLAMQKYLGTEIPVYLLPLAAEQLPISATGEGFDTVFSMGVLYHRRDHLAHLAELRRCLLPGGELVLETLVIEGAVGEVLVPGERYARMRNVWALPSVPTLTKWLREAGFTAPRLVDESLTTTDEQRATEWMQFESLDKCLDSVNPALTVEGHPAPRRAVVVANRPI